MVFVCCVPNCTNAIAPMRCFPRDPELCRKWICLIKREDLLTKNLLNYRVCNKHFSSVDQFPKVRNRTGIKCSSWPKLYLPEDTPCDPLKLENCEIDADNSEHTLITDDDYVIQYDPIAKPSQLNTSETNSNAVHYLIKTKKGRISANTSHKKIIKLKKKKKALCELRLLKTELFKAVLELKNKIIEINKQCEYYKENLSKKSESTDCDPSNKVSSDDNSSDDEQDFTQKFILNMLSNYYKRKKKINNTFLQQS